MWWLTWTCMASGADDVPAVAFAKATADGIVVVYPYKTQYPVTTMVSHTARGEAAIDLPTRADKSTDKKLPTAEVKGKTLFLPVTKIETQTGHTSQLTLYKHAQFRRANGAEVSRKDAESMLADWKAIVVADAAYPTTANHTALLNPDALTLIAAQTTRLDPDKTPAPTAERPGFVTARVAGDRLELRDNDVQKWSFAYSIEVQPKRFETAPVDVRRTTSTVRSLPLRYVNISFADGRPAVEADFRKALAEERMCVGTLDGKPLSAEWRGCFKPDALVIQQAAPMMQPAYPYYYAPTTVYAVPAVTAIPAPPPAAEPIDVPAAQIDVPAAPKVAIDDADLQKLLELTDGERRWLDLPPLVVNRKLMDVAQKHANKMAQLGRMGHRLDGDGGVEERARTAGYKFSAVGENCAEGQNDPEKAYYSWVHSEPHRAVLTNRIYTEVGLGVAKSKRGVYYWTQVFGKPAE